MDSPTNKPSSAECLIMAKPAGPRCNLKCDYCYYLAKNDLLPQEPRVMDKKLLEKYIVERLAASPGPITHFEWHGGEPTLLGLEYFRHIIRIQSEHCPEGRTITNGLQTNGILLNRDWARFLARRNFSVGLSLDGPAELHDAHRKTAGGDPTHASVMRAFRLLKEVGVHTNVLCVVHKENAALPEKTYTFFRELGVNYLQFLPLVKQPLAELPDFPAAQPEVVGDFLCRIFDLWIQQDVGRIVIQTFDEALRPAMGVPHALCINRITCGDVAVLERDGGFYACDHFVDPAHRLGNLQAENLKVLADDPRLHQFGLAKRDALPETCRQCTYLAWCNGGCPKDRSPVATVHIEQGMNLLCTAFKVFFKHATPTLALLARHMQAGLPLRSFRAQL